MKWDADKYDNYASHVAQCGSDVLELLAPQSGERILDLGCGTGTLAKELVSRACVVLGIDSSPNMVKAAKKAGVPAMVMDAQKMTFCNEFDAVFSNAALHWMKATVLSNVYSALKSGGRFCAEFGAKENLSQILHALYAELENFGLAGADYNPWYFPSGEEYTESLEMHGFSIRELRVFERPTKLSGTLSDWLQIFTKDFLVDVPSHIHGAVIHAVSHRLKDQLYHDDGFWYVDYVRCRCLAVKP